MGDLKTLIHYIRIIYYLISGQKDVEYAIK